MNYEKCFERWWSEGVAKGSEFCYFWRSVIDFAEGKMNRTEGKQDQKEEMENC